jgi:hypothetical protein
MKKILLILIGYLLVITPKFSLAGIEDNCDDPYVCRHVHVDAADKLNTWAGRDSMSSKGETALKNTAFGDEAMQLLTLTGTYDDGEPKGVRNTAFGYRAMQGVYAIDGVPTAPENGGTKPSGGSFNTALGGASLLRITEGRYNTAVGLSAMSGNTTGSFNTGIGLEALRGNPGNGVNNYYQIGDYNTALGMYALTYNHTGSKNTAVGTFAGAIAFANDMGWISFAEDDPLQGANNTAGSYNVFIGYLSGPASPDLHNAIAIGARAVVKRSNQLVLGGTGDYSVNVGIGTDDPNYKLHVHNSKSPSVWIQLSNKRIGSGPYDGFFLGVEDIGGTDTAQLWSEPGMDIRVIPGGNYTSVIFKANGNVGIGTTNPAEKLYVVGNIYATGTIMEGSSRESKYNIRELTIEEAVATLNNLQPKKFYYKVDNEDEHLGFIAEDVPDLVATKDRKGIRPMDIIAVLTSVVKEQQKMISSLSQKVEELEKEVKLYMTQ